MSAPEKCWIISGCDTGRGYKRISIQNKDWLAHRFSWLLHRGPIPAGLHVLHKCDNPPCVNPEHLFLGTDADNMHDCRNKGRYHLQRHPELAPRGSRHPRAKLNEAQVERIKSEPHTDGFWAQLFGVSKDTILAVRHGKTWRHVQPLALGKEQS